MSGARHFSRLTQGFRAKLRCRVGVAAFSRHDAPAEVALERACLLLPTGSEKHNARRIIASKIIECANRGDATLSRLTEAGYAAAMQLTASGQSIREKEAANY